MLTKEQISELAAESAAKVVAQLREPIRTFAPGDEEVPPGIEDTKTTYKAFGEFLRAISDFHTGKGMDARLKALSEGSDTAGGFTVPEQFASGIEVYAIEGSIVRPLARKMPMATDVLNYPLVTSTSHSSSVHGGVIAYWTEEAGTKTASDPTFGRIKLIAKKLTGFTYASDELLEDSAVALEALLLKLFGEAIVWYEEEAFWQGNGVGQPLGIFTSGAFLNPFRAVANQVALADLGTIMSRFRGDPYGRSVAWVANKAILTQLIPLGNTVLTWSAIAGQRIPSSLFGIPLYFSEHVPTLGTTGDIGLYDFDQYVIGDRKGLKVDRSTEYRFNTDETTWRFVKRVDGQPLIDSAFTPKRGNTSSPFVGLNSATA